MLTKFMKLWLLQSGVEWNPGPKRKAPTKCSKCKRIVSSAGLCLTCDYEPKTTVFASQPQPGCSTNNDSHGNSPDCNHDRLAQMMVLYKPITSNFTMKQATVEELVQAGYCFGFYDSPKQTVISHGHNNLLLYKIEELQDVNPDGACLFNVFSLLLFGNENAANTIRRKVCEAMLTIDFRPDQLFVNGSCQNTVQQYLKESCMTYRYAYGGDVEISTFCHLTKLSVLVFVATISGWVEYKDPLATDDNVQHPQVFLYLEANHFQLVTKLHSTHAPVTNVSFVHCPRANLNTTESFESDVSHTIGSFPGNSSKIKITHQNDPLIGRTFGEVNVNPVKKPLSSTTCAGNFDLLKQRQKFDASCNLFTFFE